MRDQKRKQVAANTSAPTDTIPYDDAVSEGKEILAKIEDAERGQLRLGELADRLEPKYGDRTLAKFAKALDIAPCTLKRYLSVYRAWKGIGAPGPQSVSYSVLRELETHPDRAQIIQDRPNLTKREAHDLMRKYEGAAEEKQKQDQEDDWLKHSRKWFKDLVALANEVHRAACVADECTSEQLDNLLQVIDPGSLMYLHGAGRRLFNLANHLAELLGGEEVQQFETQPIIRARRAEAQEQQLKRQLIRCPRRSALIGGGTTVGTRSQAAAMFRLDAKTALFRHG
jgi:hypothetical protein